MGVIEEYWCGMYASLRPQPLPNLMNRCYFLSELSWVCIKKVTTFVIPEKVVRRPAQSGDVTI